MDPDPEIPWHLATTLSERAAWRSGPGEVDADRGALRLEMWGDLRSFSGDGRGDLAEWLGAMGLTVEEFTALLGETEPSLRARRSGEPEWHRSFVRWWNSARRTRVHRLHGDLEMIEWARPLVEGAVAELAAKLGDLVEKQTDPVCKDEGIVDRFLETVPLEHLHTLLQRTTVLELNVFRVEGRLAGEEPADRFEDFCRQLSTDEVAIPLWREYCVLARLVVTQLRFWIDSQIALFNALAEDLDLIRESIPQMANASRLESISLGEGDRHRHGLSVGILRFDQGTVVHKPRSLAMDEAYGGLIDWLNAHGLTHDLRAVETLDRGDHGWVRFLESDQRTDADGARRFAWRTGALAAVLYALHATDFHFENIIASGEHPVLVDLETLLHSDKTDAVANVEGTTDASATALAQSVHSTGLLPNPLIMRDDDGTHALDMSGAAGRGGQQTPMPVPTWEDRATDAMRLVKRRMEMDGERNQAVAEDGTPFDIAGNRDAVVEGFGEVYKLLEVHRDALLGEDGPLSAFGNIHTRHIARATHVYGTVLLESTHPDFLRDGLDRDRSLARLQLGHDSRPERAEMIDSEIRELTDGDIPFFTIDTSTGVLYGGTPARPIGQRSEPLADVEDRIRSLGERDRLHQQWIVDASMAATTMVGKEARWPNWSRPVASEGVSTGDLEEHALAIARRLQSLLIRGEDSLGWLGLDLVDEQHWMLAPAPIGLYNGIGGITHALDAVAAVTGDRSLADEVERLHDYIVRRTGLLADTFEDAESGPPTVELTPVGAFSETAGSVYVLAHAAARHGDERYAAAAVRLLPILEQVVDQDDNFDIIAGCAGLILVMESLEAVAPGRGAAELASRAAQRVIDGRKEFATGWGWVSPVNDGAALNGFSHGTSGIAAALARFNSSHADPRYRRAIDRALAYENATYDREKGVWTDLRSDNLGGRTVMNAWCHGAPGIGLSRQMMLDAGDCGVEEGQLRSDRDRAARILYEAGWSGDPVTGMGNHSLCHGDVGNLLLLESTAADADIRERLPLLWRSMLDAGSADGWLCGVPHGVETPGLMTGLAGIAWGLARKADPKRVSDLLRLEPPRGVADDERD